MTFSAESMVLKKRAREGDLNFSLHGAPDICMLTVGSSAGLLQTLEGHRDGNPRGGE